jgi:signal peptidase II
MGKARMMQNPAEAHAPLRAEEPEPPDPLGPSAAAPEPKRAAGERPSYVFFGVVSAITLIADVASKAWAEVVLSEPGRYRPSIVIIDEYLSLTLAYNPGGAWGLLTNASEVIRRPFFLGVSVAAVVFIVSLYSRLAPGQRALKWGLPLVLGGALGNLADRIIRSKVVDSIIAPIGSAA